MLLILSGAVPPGRAPGFDRGWPLPFNGKVRVPSVGRQYQHGPGLQPENHTHLHPAPTTTHPTPYYQTHILLLTRYTETDIHQETLDMDEYLMAEYDTTAAVRSLLHNLTAV